MVFGLFGIHWVMPHKVIGMFNCWLGKLSSRGLCHIVCVGVFDRNEMLDALRIVNGLFFRLSLFSSLLSLSGV